MASARLVISIEVFTKGAELYGEHSVCPPSAQSLRDEWSIGGFKMNRNINAKWGKIKMISSFALFTSAFLALIAGVNAVNPKWRPLYTAALFGPKDGSSTNLNSLLFR